MAQSSIANPLGDAGRDLTVDVTTLALTLPVVSRGALELVITPFIFAAALLLITLFIFPLRDLPFVARPVSHGLSALRLLLAALAFANLLFSGYPAMDALSYRWIVTMLVAVVSVMVTTMDIRRLLP